MPEQDKRQKRYTDSGEDDIDLAVTEVLLPSGRRLTDDVAEDLVAQARRSAGRPSLDGAADDSPRIAFRVPRQMKEQLEAIASEEGRSFSEVSREAIGDYLSQRRSA